MIDLPTQFFNEMVFDGYLHFWKWVGIHINYIRTDRSTCQLFYYQRCSFEHGYSIGNIGSFFKTGSSVSTKTMTERSFSNAYGIKPGRFKENIFSGICNSTMQSAKYTGNAHAF